ncbi:hypothetical protein ABZS78_39310, partial [Streptomyces decoyicus]
HPYRFVAHNGEINTVKGNRNWMRARESQLASRAPLPIAALARRTAGDAFPARVEHGPALRRLIADAVPVRDHEAVASPVPPDGAFSVG